LSKESNSTVLARIEERLKNFIVLNDKDHKDIGRKIDDLCGKVNHQVSSFEARIRSLEDRSLKEESKYRGRMQLFKWASIALSLIIAGMTIAHMLGIF